MNANYRIDSTTSFTYDGNRYVVITATFHRGSGDFTATELYRVEGGIEMFKGYVRGSAPCVIQNYAVGPVARYAREVLAAEEQARWS